MSVLLYNFLILLFKILFIFNFFLSIPIYHFFYSNFIVFVYIFLTLNFIVINIKKYKFLIPQYNVNVIYVFSIQKYFKFFGSSYLILTLYYYQNINTAHFILKRIWH